LLLILKVVAVVVVAVVAPPEHLMVEVDLLTLTITL